MNSCSGNELRRCRPLLGTFVEIGASAGSVEEKERLHRAVESAFAQVEQIHRLMSVHEPASELSVLNREAARQAVQVSPETFDVLRRGLRLSRESSGAFDFTVAPLLASWGLLPAELKRRRCGTWRSVRLLRGRRVRFDQPVAIDLGGIAKGYAVDVAVSALQKAGAESGWVTAGGDLKVFGSRPLTVGIRHPVTGDTLPNAIQLSNEAMASSSPAATRKRWRNVLISPLIDARQRQAIASQVGVTVRAAECWVADALTKVVMGSMNRANRRRLEALLNRYQATAQIFTP